MAVSAYSKQPDAAWYFVQWATSPDIQKQMAVQGIAAPRSAVANDPEYRKWIDEQPVRKEWQAALDVLAAKGSSEVGYPIVANPESREFIGQAVQDLILKQKIGRPGLRRCRQEPRCADRQKVDRPSSYDRQSRRCGPSSNVAACQRRTRKDRQRRELAALSAPAVALHGGDDRVSGRLYDLARLSQLFLDRAAELCRSRQLRQAGRRHRILARAMGHSCAVPAVAGAPARARNLAGADIVSCQAPAGRGSIAVHLAVHDAAGGGRHDVAGDPRSVAWRRQLPVCSASACRRRTGWRRRPG